MGTDSQVPLAQRLKCRHLLDVVWVEVLQLEPVIIEDHSSEPPGGDGEAAFVEGHKRDDIPSRRTRHEGSCPTSTRQRSIERVTMERDQFDMATASFRARL
jgi:hypothetical protein